MRHIEQRNSRGGFFVTFVVCLFLAAATGAAWLGYFMFNPSRGNFSEEQVVVTVSAPEHIIAGIEDDYSVTVQNTSAREIAAAEMNLHAPQGFIIVSADPVAVTTKNERWTLGGISSGGEKVVHIKALYLGKPGAEDVLRALVSYRPSNFNADFEKVADQKISVESTAIVLGVTSVTTDKNTTHTILLANTASTSILNTQLVAELGSDVTISKTTPAAQISGGEITLPFAEIKGQSTSTLIIITTPKTGSAAAPFAAPKSVSLQRANGDTPIIFAQTDFGSATSTTTSTPATASKTAGFSLTSSIDHPMALKAGDAIPFTIHFTNGTSAPIKNAKFAVSVEAPSSKNKSIFDFLNLQSTGDPLVMGNQLTPDRRAATITWLAKDVPDLAEIAPGASVSVLFTVGVKDAGSYSPFPAGLNASFVAAITGDGFSQSGTPVQMTFGAQ